ncbi:hypothetical protein J4E82_009533 [Alternaria postmessia]|uniref:uncharacterized protein n=1 Tax=Alternaria postmessia TaxID=1187938 RepID=UPI002224CA31|nr:uncharacterized protein J4E82_009533 [Alternaria postmessia]KAI5371794.1 hypothetical protein J4E82_009533 [Alternaria postmessia]
MPSIASETPTSSSVVPSSVIVEPSSSASSSAALPSTSSTSSSILVSSTPVATPLPSSGGPSPTQSCIARSANYVSNGNFESGALSGYTIDTSRSTVSIVNDASSAHSGSYFIRGTSTENNSKDNNKAIFTRYNINIPSGTKVVVSAWFKSLRSETERIQRFRIYLDGTELGNFVPVNGDKKWVRVGNTESTPHTVSKAMTHKLEFRVDNNPSDGPYFDIDDVSIVAVDCSTVKLISY